MVANSRQSEIKHRHAVEREEGVEIEDASSEGQYNSGIDPLPGFLRVAGHMAGQSNIET